MSTINIFFYYETVLFEKGFWKILVNVIFQQWLSIATESLIKF